MCTVLKQAMFFGITSQCIYLLSVSDSTLIINRYKIDVEGNWSTTIKR